MSQLLKSFLDPHHIEFSSSILNDINSLRKIVKGVPYKLRVERGQSLNAFLQKLLKSVKQPKPKVNAHKSTNEDVLETKLNNKLFHDSDRSKKVIKKQAASMLNSDLNENQTASSTSPFESFLFLRMQIFLYCYFYQVLYATLFIFFEFVT